jgi:acyl carrier protein
MTEAEVFEVLGDVANEVLAVDPATLTDATTLEDLDADSLQLLEMLSIVEMRFPELAPLGEDGLPDLVTFGDVVRFILDSAA